MSIFNIFRSNRAPEKPLADRALVYCPAIQELSKLSVTKHLSPRADEFDYDMAAYSAFGIFMVYLYAHFGENSVQPITMKIFDWAEEHGVQKLGAVITYGRLKISFNDGGSTDKLGSAILEDLSYLSPIHAPVYKDLVWFVESIIPKIAKG
ncbi:MAG: hypothetical protein RLZZ505_2174 [Verrucomicrobiota bacterium]|jgi:hypothetical protein